MNWFTEKYVELREKLNPAQTRIADQSGSHIGTDSKISYQQAFKKLEPVRRGINKIVDACASLDFDVKDKVSDGVVGNVRQKELVKLLNFKPNPYQSANDFRKALYTDFILEGYCFVYFDGKFLYHL